MKVIKFSMITFFITFTVLIINLLTFFKPKSVTYELGITIVTLAIISAVITIIITLVVSILVYLINGKNKKLRITLLFSILAIFTGFQIYTRIIDSKVNIGDIGIDLPKGGIVLVYEDTHGGFHGDGDTFAKIEFDTSDGKSIISQITKHKGWNELPLSENLNLIMYGGERNNMNYGYNFAERVGIPDIESGYWFFVDRHSQSTSPEKDVDLFNRYSFNFTLAIYDTNTNTLYYFEYDT